ncbi:unnamed protein product [Rhizophagus irregularis]|nr:unnamed protein product [Rhizophagus irregularis]CAB4434097.1 unnamed protein product [Rhizophagus irregularis]
MVFNGVVATASNKDPPFYFNKGGHFNENFSTYCDCLFPSDFRSFISREDDARSIFPFSALWRRESNLSETSDVLIKLLSDVDPVGV